MQHIDVLASLLNAINVLHGGPPLPGEDYVTLKLVEQTDGTILLEEHDSVGVLKSTVPIGPSEPSAITLLPVA